MNIQRCNKFKLPRTNFDVQNCSKNEVFEMWIKIENSHIRNNTKEILKW